MSDNVETVTEKKTEMAPPKKGATKKAKGAKKAKTNGKGAKKAKGAKAKGAKAKGAKASKGKPTTGQSGPEIEVKTEDLNAKESKVLDLLNGKGEGARETVTIPELTKVFKNTADTKAQANSWVRNSLRRLVTSGLVEKLERGSYRIAERARKRLQRAEA